MGCALAKRSNAIRGRSSSDEAEVLRVGDASLPFRRAAHGPRAQLRDRRCAGTLYVDERLQRPASDGLGFVRVAGGECGDQEQYSAAKEDAREIRGPEGADEVPRFSL